jgi:subtilase family serine protease
MTSFIAPTGAALPAAATVSAGTVSAANPTPAASAGQQSKQGRIKVLLAALRFMKKNYAKFADFSPGPQDLFDYNIGNLWRQGIDGSGTSIALIEGWDFPNIASAVARIDKLFHLPNPQIQTIFPNGPLPAKCPAGMVKLGSYGSCDAWKGELELDVITAHLIAPYAKIVISATPADSEIIDDAASQVAPPEMMKALEQISSNHLANVISISDGTGESTYSHGQEEITAQDPGELTAAAAGIPVMVATGDCGVVQNLAVANGQCEDVSAAPDTAAWDDSPWVTAVGGSVPNFSSSGQRLGPDPVWHEGLFSEGAGFSSVFARPSYQDGVSFITGSSMRSVPDITADAQDGTSEAAPLFAGILALATQMNHANVGPINPALYNILGPAGTADGIADVIKGNNSTPTVPGFTAAKGFDVATGWGTINASKFVPGLVAATKAEHQEQASRSQATTALRRLENSIQLSPDSIPARHKAYLLDTGFLPGHPVELSIDGQQVATLTATSLGYVTYMLDPAALSLSPGPHVLQLTSMLLTSTKTFSSN